MNLTDLVVLSIVCQGILNAYFLYKIWNKEDSKTIINLDVKK